MIGILAHYVFEQFLDLLGDCAHCGWIEMDHGQIERSLYRLSAMYGSIITCRILLGVGHQAAIRAQPPAVIHSSSVSSRLDELHRLHAGSRFCISLVPPGQPTGITWSNVSAGRMPQ